MKSRRALDVTTMISHQKVADFRFLTRALYDVISTPANGRNWDAIRHFYHRDARLVRTGKDEQGNASCQVQSLDAYILDVEGQLADAQFVERELTHQCQIFGNVAQVSSVYEYELVSPSVKRSGRGVNFMTLAFDQDQWRIMSIVWDNERPGLELPVGLTNP